MAFGQLKIYLFTFCIGLMTFNGYEAEAKFSRSGGSFSSSRSSSWGRSSSSRNTSSFGSSSKKSSNKGFSSWGSSKTKPTAKPTQKSTTKSTNSSSWGSTKQKATTTKSDRSKVMAEKKKAQTQRQYTKSKTAVKNTTSKDWKASKSSYTAKSNYKPRKDVSYSNRYTGNQRTVVINRYNNSYGGYYYNDPYDHSMIWGFSTLWWYHHWNSIDRTHYAQDARMRQIEAEVAAMRAKGITQNADYMDPGMDKTTAYSTGYLQGVKDNKFQQEKKSYAWVWTIIIIILVIGGIGILIWLSKRDSGDSGGPAYYNDDDPDRY